MGTPFTIYKLSQRLHNFRMQKFIFSLITIAFCTSALAQTSLTDYLRTAPARVSGQIEFEAPHSIYRSNGNRLSLITSGIRASKPIGFELNEVQFSLNTNNAVYVSVAGLPVNITNLSYDARTGQVDVHSSFFGTRFNSPLIEKRVRAEVQREFGPKLKTAFERLSYLRSQRSLNDANNVLDSVVHAFDGDGKGEGGLPNFHGRLSIVNPVARNQTVVIDKDLSADLQAGDTLETTLLFRAPHKQRLQVKGLSLYSPSTIRLHSPKTSDRSIKAANVRVISISEEGGLQISATNGVDETVTNSVNAAKTIAALIAVANHESANGLVDCESVTVVQQYINGKARGGLQNYVRTNRAALMRAGATPQLLRAIETNSDPFRDLAEANPRRRK